MRRGRQALVLGALIACLGVAVSVLPFGAALEEGLGLQALFMLRGSRPAPPEVVIVGIDRHSWETLGLPDNPERWPRSLHGRLVDALARAGAAVIAFDIVFEEPRSGGEDRLFANAMARAGRVVLCECLRRQTIVLRGTHGDAPGDIMVERLVMPAAPLAGSALGLGPFPLPKVPVTVSRYWTFKTGAGGSPSLPVVVFQVYALEAYGELIRLIEGAGAGVSGTLPKDASAVLRTGRVERHVGAIRDLFEKDPGLGGKIRRALSEGNPSSPPSEKHRMLASLVRMYESPESAYLDFYGPPLTIPTVPFVDVLSASGEGGRHEGHDFRGKAVFVGLSEPYPDLKDGFHTVFSDSRGVDLSGVEIAATAFANLLEDRPVRPLPAVLNSGIVLLWGLLIGVFVMMSSTALSLVAGIGLAGMYLAVAAYQLKMSSLWCPVVVPLLVQTPLGIFGSLLWRYLETARERRNIKKALAFYLPEQVVDRVAKDLAELRRSSEVIYGTCLSTDAEHYTTLAEQLEPKELAGLMNRYFEALFDPVRRHGGIISNVVADSVLALWVTAEPGALVRTQGCAAALEISAAVAAFNRSSAYQLPTRIGLHSGEVVLGAVGALDHFEYRPMGDIVNTASRVEGLNKHLGTKVLISDEMVETGFVTRELGAFLLAGKARPLVVHELLCEERAASNDLIELRSSFAEALACFRKRSWAEAADRFGAIETKCGGDGPASFYRALCRVYLESPPQEPWDGTVRIEGK